MFDTFAYLLGKRAGGGSGGNGWTKKNANHIVAVIESLPEEIMIEGKRQTALYGLDDADFDIYHTRLVYLPDHHCYEGHCTLHFFSGSDQVAYVACGYIRLELDENNLEMETKFCGEYIEGDGSRAPVEFAIDLSALTLVAYKGAPIEIPTITFTINSTEYNAVEGMTWLEWLNSEYNPGDYYHDGEGETVYSPNWTHVYKPDGYPAYEWETIVSGANYQYE